MRAVEANVRRLPCLWPYGPPSQPHAPTPKPTAPTPDTRTAAAPLPPAATYVNCEDKHKSCAGWASLGECKKNPGYMVETCPLSCGACVVPELDVAAFRSQGKILVLDTPYGEIRANLLWQVSPQTAALVMELAERSNCSSCNFYRNEAAPTKEVSKSSPRAPWGDAALPRPRAEEGGLVAPRRTPLSGSGDLHTGGLSLFLLVDSASTGACTPRHNGAY